MILYKCSPSGHVASVIIHIWIPGVSAVWGFLPMRWLHHQSELGADRCRLCCLVGWFYRNVPVKVRHQTSHLSHVLSAVNMKSQFDIYFTNRKTQLNITSYTWSKLNREFQIFQSIGKCQVHIHRAQLFKCWDCMLQFSSKHFVSPPSPNPHKAQHTQCKYKIKFRRNL